MAVTQLPFQRPAWRNAQWKEVQAHPQNYKVIRNRQNAITIGPNIVVRQPVRGSMKFAEESEFARRMDPEDQEKLLHEIVEIQKPLGKIVGVPRVMYDKKRNVVIEEKAPGYTLYDWNKYHGGLTPQEQAHVAREFTRIHGAMKAKGVLYGDVHGKNVMFDRASGMVSVVDFDRDTINNPRMLHGRFEDVAKPSDFGPTGDAVTPALVKKQFFNPGVWRSGVY